MNDNKTPRKLTSSEFYLLKWNLQKSRSVLEYKLDTHAIKSPSLKEYHESQIKHLKKDIAELTMLINALHDNRRALYELDAE